MSIVSVCGAIDASIASAFACASASVSVCGSALERSLYPAVSAFSSMSAAVVVKSCVKCVRNKAIRNLDAVPSTRGRLCGADAIL